MVGINSIGMLHVFLFAYKQLHRWKILFENKWDSDTEMQYRQMKKNASAYFWIFVITTSFIPIYFSRIRGWMKILQKIGFVNRMIILLYLSCIIYASLIFSIILSLFTQTNTFLKYFPDVSIFHLNLNDFSSSIFT